MKKKLWKEFELTGKIDTYLYYKSSIDALDTENYDELDDYSTDIQTIE